MRRRYRTKRSPLLWTIVALALFLVCLFGGYTYRYHRSNGLVFQQQQQQQSEYELAPPPTPDDNTAVANTVVLTKGSTTEKAHFESIVEASSLWAQLLLLSQLNQKEQVEGANELPFEWHRANGEPFPSPNATRASLVEYLNQHVVLVANVASHCGYTVKNYKGFVALHKRYATDESVQVVGEERRSRKGLLVLVFPSDDFGHQEPDTAIDVEANMKTQYGVEFPVMRKIHVKAQKINSPLPRAGENKEAMIETEVPMLFKLLQEQQQHVKKNGETHSKASWSIPWNFAKFLIGRRGQPVMHFSHDASFDLIDVEVKKLLDS